MIKTFGDKFSEDILEGKVVRSKKFPLDKNLQQKARRRLRYLNSAGSLMDLYIPPSNRFEALKGNLKGYYSLSINMQWRIIFRFDEELNEAYDVQIVDYH